MENFYQTTQTQTNFKVIAFVLLSWLAISSNIYVINLGKYQRAQLIYRLTSY